MNSSSGRGMAPTRTALALVIISVIATCRGGPLGNLQNVTSADVGIIEGSCALGDVVYMPGDEFPGSSPCEKCSCAAGGVHCARQRCEPRPGCKALHRPDHCCPTYQCECEQEGRVYGNGEKLVDPADPCRVCYCQGGEVVCRRIACFVRDDCQPRLVPGRCCPEYDNCPLRGVTTAPGAAPATSSVSPIEDVGTSVIHSTQKENIKQEITIKEITPVSEIPVITEVKIKEILPSHGIDVAEYSSSKAPLIPREATTDRSISKEDMSKIDTPVVIEVISSSTYSPISSSFPSAKPNLDVQVAKQDNSQPSKIRLSTQDTNNSEVYSSNIPIVVTMGSYSIASERAPIVIVTRSPIMEEEEPVEHNPAFPPLPDDLSVLSNHDDEINSEQNIDMHLSGGEEVGGASTEAQTTKQTIMTSTSKAFDITSTIKSRPPETPRTTDIVKIDTPISEETLQSNSSPTLNLRSAIPTEILNAATGDLNIALETAASTTNAPITILDSKKVEPSAVVGSKLIESEKKTVTLDTNSSGITDFDTSTHETSRTTNIASKPQEQTTSSIAKSNVATEVTLQTELSSLPIETSDQNPHETIDSLKEKISSPSVQDNVYTDITTVKTAVGESETDRPSTSRDTKLYNNVETTEFILTSFDSSETATDAVELIKISPEAEEKAAIIEPGERHQNVLTDLINLVGDVASISDQTDEPSAQHVPITTEIAESEELIPVNAGYKSKNKNYNQNTITESAMKNKNSVQVNKLKTVEIEDDDFTITDPPSPNDKVEPTTKRPIIDNVSDDVPENKTEKKDIEIINKTYVPTVNRRPTKVIMKKNHEKPLLDETSTETATSSISSHSPTELPSLVEDLVTGTPNFPDESSEMINVSTKASTSSITP